jgi:hypothetical protein
MRTGDGARAICGNRLKENTVRGSPHTRHRSSLCPKLKPPADLFQITLHFDRGKSALGHDALQALWSFQDQYRDDGGMPRHRVTGITQWRTVRQP